MSCRRRGPKHGGSLLPGPAIALRSSDGARGQASWLPKRRIDTPLLASIASPDHERPVVEGGHPGSGLPSQVAPERRRSITATRIRRTRLQDGPARRQKLAWRRWLCACARGCAPAGGGSAASHCVVRRCGNERSVQVDWSRLRPRLVANRAARVVRGAPIEALLLKALLLKVWGRLRSNPWFVPTAMACLAVLMALCAVAIDEAGTVFSMTLVALSLASSPLGPRLLRNFMRDTADQRVLGTFVATFVHCPLVLRTIRRADEVVARVGKELDEGIDRLFPARLGEPGSAAFRTPGAADLPLAFAREASPGGAAEDGSLQLIDARALMALASENDLLLRLECRPGTTSTRGGRWCWSGVAIE